MQYIKTPTREIPTNVEGYNHPSRSFWEQMKGIQRGYDVRLTLYTFGDVEGWFADFGAADSNYADFTEANENKSVELMNEPHNITDIRAAKDDPNQLWLYGGRWNLVDDKRPELESEGFTLKEELH